MYQSCPRQLVLEFSHRLGRSKRKTGREFLSATQFLASLDEIPGSCVHLRCDVVRLRAFRMIMQHLIRLTAKATTLAHR
jgi:hypothetical protein